MINQEILEFIKRRFPTNNGNWLTGNCFWFSYILKGRFPEGEIWYEPIVGHFLLKYDNYFYDWTGIYKDDTSKAFNFTREYDSNLYDILVRDCIC